MILSASIEEAPLPSTSESGPARIWAPAVALGLYAFAILFVGASHEAWVDEAQAWLIGRDAAPWEIVSRYARYEGTPALWHLLLWAAARASFPFAGLWLISGALAMGGAALILFRSPFPLAMRCAVVLGYYFAYQYPIVARSYALDLVLVPLLAMLHERRLDRPLVYGGVLAAMANANTHSLVVACVLGLELAVSAWQVGRWREPRVLGGGALVFAFGLLAVVSAWPPPDLGVPFDPVSPVKALGSAMLMSEAFLDRVDVWSAAQPSVLARLVGLVASILLLVPSLSLFTLGRVKGFFLLIAGGFFAFTVMKYGKGWHAGVLYLAWIFCLWVSWPRRAMMAVREQKALSISLCAILGFQVVYTAAAWGREVRQVYGPGAEVAKVVADYRKDHPSAKVAAFGFYSFVVQPWAASNLFDNFAGAAPGVAFYDWRSSQPLKPHADLQDWRTAIAEGKVDILLLSNLEPNERAPYEAAAAKAGYCARLVDGQLIWKTYNSETLAVEVFLPCTR